MGLKLGSTSLEAGRALGAVGQSEWWVRGVGAGTRPKGHTCQGLRGLVRRRAFPDRWAGKREGPGCGVRLSLGSRDHEGMRCLLEFVESFETVLPGPGCESLAWVT